MLPVQSNAKISTDVASHLSTDPTPAHAPATTSFARTYSIVAPGAAENPHARPPRPATAKERTPPWNRDTQPGDAPRPTLAQQFPPGGKRTASFRPETATLRREGESAQNRFRAVSESRPSTVGVKAPCVRPISSAHYSQDCKPRCGLSGLAGLS
jgi:hypothetical protein